MLNITVNQPLIFFIFFTFGIVTFLIYLPLEKLINKTKINKVLLFIYDTLFCLIVFTTFFFLLLKFNYGQLRFYIVISTLLGIFLTNKIFTFIVAKISQRRYNRLS